MRPIARAAFALCLWTALLEAPSAVAQPSAPSQPSAPPASTALTVGPPPSGAAAPGSAAPAPAPAPAAPAPAIYQPPPPAAGPAQGEGEAAPWSEDSAAPKRHFGIFVDPLLLPFKIFSVQISYAPVKYVAINAGFQYQTAETDNSYETVKVSIVGGRLGAQFFPLADKAFAGFYLYPRVGYLSATGEGLVSKATAEATGYEITGMLGYQWNWRPGFALRLGGGVNRISLEESAKSAGANPTTVAINETATEPTAEISVGWTFLSRAQRPRNTESASTSSSS